MSLYNMIHGVNQATFYIAPLLELGHPETLPRFRDCFLNTDKPDLEIHIYTRVGGGNRNEGFGEEIFYNHPDYLTTFDDDFDNTFATYTFRVPEKWKSDVKLILDGKINECSEAYKELILNTFPKITDKLKETLYLTVS